MVVCEHTYVSGAENNCEVFFAESWAEAKEWCENVRRQFPYAAKHKIYAYEAVKF